MRLRETERKKRLLQRPKFHIDFKSIRFLMFFSFACMMIFLMLIMSIIIYNKFTAESRKNISKSSEQIIEQVSLNLKNYLDGMNEISCQLEAKIRGIDGVPSKEVKTQLYTILNTRKDITIIALFSSEGKCLFSIPETGLRRKGNVTEQTWYKYVKENPNKIFFSNPHIEDIFQGQYTWVVSLSRSTVTLENGYRGEEGILLLDVNIKTIDEVCHNVNLGKRGYVYITDSNGNIIYHPQQQLIYFNLKSEDTSVVSSHSHGVFLDKSNDEERIIVVKTVENSGWKVVGVTYMDDLENTKRTVVRFIVALMLVAVTLALILSFYISFLIAKPIIKLEKSMEIIEKGNFGVEIDVRGYHEVEHLSQRFNLMVTRIRILMNELIETQEAKRKSELEILQEQINPHFLYNTLNSVVRMIGYGRNDETITMITALSKFFRLSLNKGSNIILIEDELEHVRNYLTIQQIRFKNKFYFKIDAVEEVKKLKTVKLIIQPLVENSISHGFEFMNETGMIEITVCIEEDKVVFEVKDNGVGIPDNILNGILSDGPRGTGSSGFGLNNVNQRIKMNFGEEYGLSISSEYEEGTSVKIFIPIIRDS